MTRKILVFSDSHEKAEYMNRAIEMNPDADLTVHLGDGASDLSRSLPDNCGDRYVFIEGNGEYYGWVGVDRRYRPQKTAMIEFEGKKIFMTHGHLYDVKFGYDKIISRAYADGADIILFGHTHVPHLSYEAEGDKKPFYLFNPGSIGRPHDGIPRFGVITVRDGAVLLSHGVLE